MSNYDIEQLDDLLEFASVVPHVNSIEYNPYQNPKELIKFCKENEIVFTVSLEK